MLLFWKFSLVLDFEFWMLNRTPSNVWQVILNCFYVQGGTVNCYKDRFLDCLGKVMPIYALNVEVVQCVCVACGGTVTVYR